MPEPYCTRVRNVHGRTISGPCVCVYVTSTYRVERSDSRENSGARILALSRRLPTAKIDMSFQRNHIPMKRVLNAHRELIRRETEQRTQRSFAGWHAPFASRQKDWNVTASPFGETSFAREEPFRWWERNINKTDVISGVEGKQNDARCIIHADMHRACFPRCDTANQWIGSSRGSRQVTECCKHPLHLSVRTHMCVYDTPTRGEIRERSLTCTPTRRTPPREASLHQAPQAQ